jgi:CHAT domain-containing protein/tetratricopeptide (TPR) repeat protein
MYRISVLLCVVALLSQIAQAADQPAKFHDQAVLHYQRAKTHFGVAMGERENSEDPANQMLERSVADVICLLGDVDGCIAASLECKRTLGPYVELLRPGSAKSGKDSARAFLGELHGLSSGWGRDSSLASEGLGLLEQQIADEWRIRARQAAMPAYREALLRARKGKPPERLQQLLRAGNLADYMLDQPKLAQAAKQIAVLLNSQAASPTDVPGGKIALRSVLDHGLAMNRILGKASEIDGIRKAIERLETKALTPPELAFEMGPGREKFKTDPAAARRELGALALRAPLRSRASVILHFLAAYAGVIDGDAQAVEQLSGLTDVVAADDPYLAARIAGLRGRASLLAGDYYRAAKLLDDAYGMIEKDKALVLLCGLMKANAGRALHYLGRYGEAVEHFEKAASLLPGRPQIAFDAWLGAAQSSGFSGEHERASAFLTKARKLLDSFSDAERGRAERRLEMNQALLLAESGKHMEAAGLLARLAEESKRAGDKVQAAISRTNLAELYNDAGTHGKALEQASAALVALGKRGPADAIWQACTEKARALASLGKLKLARQAYLRAIDLVENLRAMIGAVGSRRSFSAAKTRLYRGAVALDVKLGDVAGAFRISERARGRAFLDMLGEREIKLGDRRAEAKLAPVRRAMLRGLPQVKNFFEGPAEKLAAGHVAAKPLPKPDPGQGWISLVTVNPAKVSDVQKVLGRGEVLVSFFHDGTQLFVFVVTHGGVKLSAVELQERELHNMVASFLRAMKKPERGQQLIKKKGLRLYTKILAPLEKILPSGKLIVVPWGPLHYVPFMALWDGKRYLVDRFDSISTVPSASSLCMIRAARRKVAGGVLALGDPQTDMPDLPTAAEEVRVIGRMFKDADVQIGRLASKKAFMAGAGGAGLIHIASHGVYLPERPMDSYLALSGNPPREGRLTASEVLGVDLTKAGLVVLSACDSGRAEIGAGEEVIGMTRAFLHAGTGALLATLWPLSDESAASIIEDFYSAIRAGQKPAAALTRAARKVKQDSRFSHPFFWAPFEVIGG